jgi:hypothetical protein
MQNAADQRENNLKTGFCRQGPPYWPYRPLKPCFRNDNFTVLRHILPEKRVCFQARVSYSMNRKEGQNYKNRPLADFLDDYS